MKKNIAILFGGKSAEHDISVLTAKQVLNNLDRALYNIFPIYADENNQWRLIKDEKGFDLKNKQNLKLILKIGTNEVYFLTKFNKLKKLVNLDCAVLCFHGLNGEDGSVQGLLELCNIPYTSGGILASSVSMDKIFMKKMFENFNFPVIDYFNFNKCEYEQDSEKILHILTKKLGFPLIIKPSNLGSSIGISKSNNVDELKNAISIAFNYDDNILVEKAQENFKEINCACLGYLNDVLISALEQPVNWQEFLSFKDKYENSTKKARNRIYPAKLPIKIERKIKNISRDIFEKFRLSGVVRIDFIVKDEKVFVNEINSIPGSLAFYLFEKQNLSFSDVLNKLIEFATLKNKDKNKLTFVYDSKVLTKLKNL